MAWSRFFPSVPIPPGRLIKALWRSISNSFCQWPDRRVCVDRPRRQVLSGSQTNRHKRSYSPLNPFYAYAHHAYN
jgi:hypothetical protein